MMSIEIKAIYENGVFRPLQPVTLPELQQVTIRLSDETEGIDSHADRPTSADAEEQDIEPIWRGVFPVEQKPKAESVQSVKVKISELPELQPTITLNPRWFEEEHDDTVVRHAAILRTASIPRSL